MSSHRDERLRLFIALYPPSEIAGALLKALGGLSLPAHRLVPADQVHMTLHFIGQTPKGELHQTVESVRRSTAGLGGFALQVRRLITLPQRPPVRLVAAETDRPPVLLEIQRRLATRLAREARRNPGDRFRPHLTLCRFKRPTRQAAVDEPLSVGAFDVRRILLMRSTLAPEGAQHEELESFALGA